MASTNGRRGLVVARCGTGGHPELRPPFTVCEASGVDVGILAVRLIERDESGAIWIVDVAQVVQPQVMDEITTMKLGT